MSSSQDPAVTDEAGTTKQLLRTLFVEHHLPERQTRRQEDSRTKGVYGWRWLSVMQKEQNLQWLGKSVVLYRQRQLREWLSSKSLPWTCIFCVVGYLPSFIHL